jgi:hypothetical protein
VAASVCAKKIWGVLLHQALQRGVVSELPFDQPAASGGCTHTSSSQRQRARAAGE